VSRKYKEKDPAEDLLKAFRYFDEDNRGKISVSGIPVGRKHHLPKLSSFEEERITI
jgi:hypothetical protein